MRNLDFGNPENCPVCGRPIVGDCDCVTVPSPLDDGMVEKVARALINVSVGGPYHMGSGKWAVQGESRDLARAAIAALRGNSDA